jgi:hypothetical protein
MKLILLLLTAILTSCAFNPVEGTLYCVDKTVGDIASKNQHPKP